MVLFIFAQNKILNWEYCIVMATFFSANQVHAVHQQY